MKPSRFKNFPFAILSFSLSLTLFVLISCNTTESPSKSNTTPPDATDSSAKNDLQLLFGKDWQLTSETVSPGYIETDGNVIRNPIAQGRIASCLLDNTYRYDSNGTWTQNGGTAKCFSSELPIVTSGLWSVNPTNTMLYLTATYADSGLSNDTTYYSGLLGVPETLSIAEISADTLKLVTPRLDRDSLGYKYPDTVTAVYTLP